MAETKTTDLKYENGWLDAYGRKSRRKRMGARYNTGYDDGQRERKRTDRNLPQLRGVQIAGPGIKWS